MAVCIGGGVALAACTSLSTRSSSWRCLASHPLALRSTEAKAAFDSGSNRSAAATPTLEYSTEPCTVLPYSSLCPAYHEYREQYPPTTLYPEYCEYHA